jgi:hypothetical protein
VSRRAPLDRLYAGVVGVADLIVAHRVAVLVVGLPAVTTALAVIHFVILRGFPNSGDEYAYLYEAWTFAAGRLWNRVPTFDEAFRLNYIVFDSGRAFSSFPIGWPLALAGAAAIRVPLWLVNPALGAATIGLVAWLGARLYDARAGVVAALIVLVSPFFLFTGASYFSHTFCGVLVLGAAILASRQDRSPAWVPMSIGFLIGWAVLARYLTGAVCGFAVVGWLLRPEPGGRMRAGRTLRQLALVALGGLPWVGALAWYNHAMTGNALQITTLPLTRSLWFRPGWWYRGADFISTHLVRHVSWTPPLLAGIYVYLLAAAPRHLRRGMLTWMPILMVAALYPYVERGGNQYGPRFHYEVFPFMAIFVAAGIVRATGPGAKPGAERWTFAALAASVAVLPISFVAHTTIERRVIEERMDPYKAAGEAGLRDTVVLMADRVGTERSIAAEDLTRNGIDYSGSILYGLDLGLAANCALAARLGRRAYTYAWDHERGRRVFAPVACRP